MWLIGRQSKVLTPQPAEQQHLDLISLVTKISPAAGTTYTTNKGMFKTLQNHLSDVPYGRIG